MNASTVEQYNKAYITNDQISLAKILDNLFSAFIKTDSDISMLDDFIRVSESSNMCITDKAVENSFQGAFQALSNSAMQKKYLVVIHLCIAVYSHSNKLPFFLFHLYLQDACSKRCWVDEKAYRSFVTRLISVFRHALDSNSPCAYSPEEFHQLCDASLAFIKPILSKPVSEITEGVVMTSCTLSVIPSFQPMVAPFIRDWLEASHLQHYTKTLIERILQNISEYQWINKQVEPSHLRAIETLFATTHEKHTIYLNKLTSLLDKNPDLALILFKPSLEMRISSIMKLCIQRIPDNDDSIREALSHFIYTVMDDMEVSAHVISFNAERIASYETLLNTVVSSAAGLKELMSFAPAGYAMDMIHFICAKARKAQAFDTTQQISDLFFLIYLVFTSSIHIRRTLMQGKTSQEELFAQRSLQCEEISALIAAMIARLNSQTVTAMTVNFLGDMMYLFSRNWKELYRTKEILMNSNVFSTISFKDTKLQSPYGDNAANPVLYLANFYSFEHFRRLFRFLYAITKYNNYRNPESYQGAVEFVSIAVFERIFGIAYLQRFSEKHKKEIDWLNLISLPEECKMGPKDSSNVVELIYSTAELIKTSGKTEYYKNIGKTKLVFVMCLLTCIFPKQMQLENNSSSLLQKVMIYVMKKDVKDRNLFLTDDYASIITNICTYCDFFSYMRSVDFTCLLQYCINLNNSSITPILLSYVENLDIHQPSQLQSALTYLVLSRTKENCKNPTIITLLITNIRTWITEHPEELSTIFDRLFLREVPRQNMWKTVVDTLGTVLPNISANSYDSVVTEIVGIFGRMEEKYRLTISFYFIL